MKNSTEEATVTSFVERPQPLIVPTNGLPNSSWSFRLETAYPRLVKAETLRDS